MEQKMDRVEAIHLVMQILQADRLRHSLEDRYDMYLCNIKPNLIDRVPEEYKEAFRQISDDYGQALRALANRILDENVGEINVKDLVNNL